MTDDDDLEVDVARLRAKWFGAGAVPVRALDVEEQAIAANWLGKNEAKKLADSTNGKRYRPPVVLGHYGYIPATREPRQGRFIGVTAFGDYWYLELFRGSSVETVFEGERSECMKAVARLQRMDISVTRVGSERSPAELEPPVRTKLVRSKRFEIMDRLKRFKR